MGMNKTLTDEDGERGISHMLTIRQEFLPTNTCLPSYDVVTGTSTREPPAVQRSTSPGMVAVGALEVGCGRSRWGGEGGIAGFRRCLVGS